MPTSFGPIAVATPTAAPSLPRPVKEPGIFLLVEDVAPLLDPAGDEEVAVDAEQVLAVEARLTYFMQRADRLTAYRHASTPRLNDGVHFIDAHRMERVDREATASVGEWMADVRPEAERAAYSMIESLPLVWGFSTERQEVHR